MNFCHRVFGFSLGMGFDRGNRKTPWRNRRPQLSAVAVATVAIRLYHVDTVNLLLQTCRLFSMIFLHHIITSQFHIFHVQVQGIKSNCVFTTCSKYHSPLPLQGARPKFLDRPCFGAMRRACSQGALGVVRCGDARAHAAHIRVQCNTPVVKATVLRSRSTMSRKLLGSRRMRNTKALRRPKRSKRSGRMLFWSNLESC